MLKVAATAKDNNGIDRVGFWLDNHWVGTDRAAPYALRARVPKGTRFRSHTLTVRAFSPDGQISSLSVTLKRVRHVAGGTILPSGRIALILHAGDLVQGALALREDQRFPTGTAAGAQPARRHVVVADDSVTTRTLMKAILEGAGYDVVAVADGMEAWRSLQDTGADLLVSDVEMPRMDGFALTETVRGSPHLRDLPVILMTSRESEADKARGLHAGANAYLVKSAFDQRVLLSTIEQLL